MIKQLLPTFRKIQLRQILTTFLVGLAFLSSTALGLMSYPLQAQASPLTPEAKGYQVDRTNSQIRVNPDAIKDNAEEAGGGVIDSLKNTAETVREKLNLDEPLPDSTKAFFKQVQGQDVQLEEPRPSGKGQEALE